MRVTQEDIINAIAQSDGDLNGFIFHGTAEVFDTPLKVGAFDGLLWTSRMPTIAQWYIPSSGVQSFIPKPSSYDMNMLVRPHKNNIMTSLAVQMGYSLPECTYDHLDNLVSFTMQKANWPTQRDVWNYLTSHLGYPDQDLWVKTEINGHTLPKILPMDYRVVGKLYMTLEKDLKLFDICNEEGSLSDPQHLNVDLFRKIENSGQYDGIIINDFAQTDDGNFGHDSIGLFSHTVAALDFVSIEAQRPIYKPDQFLKSVHTYSPELQDFIVRNQNIMTPHTI